MLFGPISHASILTTLSNSQHKQFDEIRATLNCETHHPTVQQRSDAQSYGLERSVAVIRPANSPHR